MNPADPDAIVVGGGIAGLAAGYELTRRGLRPLVLEASDTLGGSVARYRLGGFDLDAGAESYAVARPAVTDLISDLGLTALVEHPAAGAAWVRHEAGIAPLPAHALLGIPGRPWAADVRRVIGPVGSARTLVDRMLPGRVAGAGSLGALVRRRLGRRVLDRLVEPVVGGVHAADPSTLEIATVVPQLPDALARAGSLAGAVRELRGPAGPSGSAVAGLRGGLYELVLALVAAIEQAGGQVRTSSGTGVWHGGDGFRVGGHRAPRLLIATGPAAAAPLIGTLVPAAPLAATQSTGTDVLLATLLVRSDALDRGPRGTGVLVSAKASGVRAKALTHATAKWAWLAASTGPGVHVVRLSYGRPGQPLPDAGRVPDLALADTGALTGLPLRPEAVEDVAVVRWPSALPSGRPGHAESVSALRAAVAGVPGLAVIGSWVAGTGLAAVISDARAVASTL